MRNIKETGRFLAEMWNVENICYTLKISMLATMYDHTTLFILRLQSHAD